MDVDSSNMSLELPSERIRAAESALTTASNNLRNVLSKDVEASLLQTFPQGLGTSVESFAADLETALEKLVKMRNESENKRTNTVKEVVRRWFRATYPFMETFLSISISGSAVRRFLTRLM